MSEPLPEPPQVEGLEAADRLPHPAAGRLAARRGVADAAGLPEPGIALRKWDLPWRPIEIAWRVALQLPTSWTRPRSSARTSCSRTTSCGRG